MYIDCTILFTFRYTKYQKAHLVSPASVNVITQLQQFIPILALLIPQELDRNQLKLAQNVQTYSKLDEIAAIFE